MRTVRGLVSKLSFTAVGVGVGLVLAAGSGAAAVHLSQTVAKEHSISVVQPDSSRDGSVLKEDSSVSGADDTVSEPAEALEPAEAAEPLDDSASRATSTDNSGQGSSHSSEAAGTAAEPGDDHGHDGSS
jgi:hypothetical protein